MHTNTTYHRLGLALFLVTALFLVWAVGALGIVGSGGRPDLMYLGVLAAALVGAAVARFRPRGMVRTSVATALGIASVTAGVLLAGAHDDAPVLDIVGITAMYVVLFLASAWLFRRAAGRHSAPTLPA